MSLKKKARRAALYEAEMAEYLRGERRNPPPRGNRSIVRRVASAIRGRRNRRMAGA
jgi:hypothetical protein